MPTRKEMAATFFLIGLTSYGGPAIVAQMRGQIVQKKGWVTQQDFEESLAFCQVLPGPLAVQTAAHIGWRLLGGFGEFLALTSYALPSVLLMTALSAFYFHFGHSPWVVGIFRGLGGVVVAVVADSILSMAESSLKDLRGILVALASAAGFFTGQDTLLVLLGSALVGAVAIQPPSTEEAHPQTGGDAAAKKERKCGAFASPLFVGFLFALFLAATRFVSPILPKLGAAMVRVNLLAFGGGYTAIALMHDLVVTAGGWLTPKEFVDGIALAQITPGPIITTATFIGYRQGGLLGAFVSTLSVFLPSAILMAILSPLFHGFRDLAVVRGAVRGLLAAFISLLFLVLWNVGTTSLGDAIAGGIAIVSFGALRLKINPLWVIFAVVTFSAIFLVRSPT